MATLTSFQQSLVEDLRNLYATKNEVENNPLNFDLASIIVSIKADRKAKADLEEYNARVEKVNDIVIMKEFKRLQDYFQSSGIRVPVAIIDNHRMILIGDSSRSCMKVFPSLKYTNTPHGAKYGEIEWKAYGGMGDTEVRKATIDELLTNEIIQRKLRKVIEFYV